MLVSQQMSELLAALVEQQRITDSLVSILSLNSIGKDIDPQFSGLQRDEGNVGRVHCSARTALRD
ncbi:hypothetical protein M514_00581 [Trichuris suis]|uniref:Uncharacterized protein n=1 Tax=Trichuris suis TaxID=68888 RepID=A0A085MMA9_9BILA|nr:hypothetical protein M513_00581 [Trichuris suis]KFD61242.1 hypothetical protein M514_00581 [Trichuris suis]